MDRPEDLQATFCATLVDEWQRAGVAHAVVSPGSRSTPLALALAASDLDLHVHLDERSAGFLALGLAAATGEPTVVLTTSGTAAVELHPAVVEADLAGVPLIVCTADRPPELIDVAAPQAIDQTLLYGRSPRWFHAPGVADPASRSRWRPLAARAYAEATAARPGPVHLNLAFREPLVGTPGELPEPRSPEGVSWAWRPTVRGRDDEVVSALHDLAGRRGVLVAGAGSGDGHLVADLAARLGWPLLAAPQAAVWAEPDAVVPAADALLRVPALAEELRPEIIVHLGAPLASRVVGEWLAATGAAEIVVAGHPSWADPHGTASLLLAVDPAAQVAGWVDELAGAEAPVPPGWRRRWSELGAVARRAIEEVLGQEPAPTEPGIAQALVDALPEGAQLVASSSMPIRDLEWCVAPSRPVTVRANRGANGIDGVVSTAVGVAVGTGAPAALLIGDIAFLHDSNGLLGATRRGIDLVVAVVDNDGGGIFSFLPQADAVDRPRFELLYGTPHGLDLVALARSLGAEAALVDDVGPAVAAAFRAGGVHVLVARTDRGSNRAVHARLNAAVAAAVASTAG